ncbi:class I SAM-dependent DNA methyltransferase [Anaerolineales bacterium HSG24]|nr:class I SAM-dependent DNA methyltransferase [Anaerolineales bacterium HSG24]
MLTGEIRSQVDRVWDAFWTGGISNPLEVIEQLTYLLFIKRLDELHTIREAKANRLQQPLEDPIFSPEQQHFRWSRFKNLAPEQQYQTMTEELFPFMRNMGNDDSAFASHMEKARFTLPPEKAGLLARVVDMIDGIPMTDRDTKGDLYEYLLSKLSTAGQNGQFRTPRHIIKMMVNLMQPTPTDTICDPACGTAGFLVAAAERLYDQYRPQIFADETLRARYSGPMFHGYDFDTTMLRVASMNMMLHGCDRPIIKNRDSLSEDNAGDEELYSLILANPPFKGSLDYDATAKDLLDMVKTKKTELLFIALFLRLLKPGGRAAVIVPDGVLFGSSRAHKTLRRTLVEKQKLEAIISMPSGVFKPYAGVSTAIVIFTKTNSGGTDYVWFYDMQADGFSLDDKRAPLGDKHEQNNMADIIARWSERDSTEQNRARTEQSFLVPQAEIVENDYDLSINRYKEIVYEEIQYDPPLQILDELAQLETEIQQGMAELRGMLV